MSQQSHILTGNRYQVYEKLGEGSMGIVYRAHDRLTDDMIALKCVITPTEHLGFTSRDSALPGDDCRLVLAQEFKTLASLRHPHIISVLDYGFDARRRPYFTMDLLEDAQDILKAGQAQSEAGKVSLLIQLLQALAYLHRRGILHRDLKPANVLVTAGQVKTLDFGLAAHTDQAAGLVGSLAYMAPEVLREASASKAADLYTVGVIAYQLLVGKYPFTLNVPAQLIAQVAKAAPDCSAIENVRLAGIVARLLAKDPAARYGSADDVILALSEAIGRPPPQENAAIRESFLQAAQFVGREAELTTLATAMDEALQGSGSAWLVGGESGVGKSRLVDELRTYAMVEGAVVLRGQAVEGGGLFYQLWRDVARRMALSVGLNDIEAGIVKELVPDIHALLARAIPDASPLTGKASWQRLNATIVDIVRRQARQQPTLLILEDLQWTAESLDVLRLLNRIVAELPLLIVGNYRSDERTNLPDELPGMEVLQLARLNRDAIKTLSMSMLGENGRQPHVVDFLQRETEGNVFFLVEVVRTLAEEVGGLSEIGAATLPDSVFAGGMQHIIQRRLNRVPKANWSLLNLAAVTGRVLDLSVLGVLAADTHLDTWLVDGARVGVLEVQEGVWSFAHDKLREALIAGLRDDERPLLHRRVAEAIETVYPNDERYASQLLQHWHIAGNLQKEMHYTCMAGRQMLEMSLFREALQLGRRMFDRLTEASASTDDPACSKALLFNLMGEAYYELGDRAQAQTHFEAGLAQARASNNRAGMAMAYHGLGDIALNRADYAAAQAHFEQSLAISRDINDQRRVLANLSKIGILYRHQGDHETARTYYDKSLNIAQEIGDRLGAATCLNSLGVLATLQGDYATAQAYYEQSLVIQREINNRSGVATSLFNLGNAVENKGEYTKVQAYYEQGLEVFREIGDVQGVAYCLLGLGNLNIQRGAYQVSANYLEKSLTIWRNLGNQVGIASVLKSLGGLTRRRGEYETARQYLEEGLALYRDAGYQYGIAVVFGRLGDLACSQADYAAATAYIENALAIYRQLNSQSAIAWCRVVLGHIAYGKERFEAAQEYYETSLVIFREINEISGKASSQCYLSFVHVALRDVDAARQLLCVALPAAHRINAVPLVLQALVGFAWLYLLDGRPQQSAALAGWVEMHPVAQVDVEVRAHLSRLLTALEPEGPKPAIAAGVVLPESLDAVVSQILAECP